MTESGFRAILDAISQKGQQRDFNFEEEHRKQLFPQICSEECTHVQCPYRRPENYSQPCKMQYEPYKTPPQHIPAVTRSLEEEIEAAVKKGFRSVEARLKRLETAPDFHSPAHGHPNGTPLQKRYSESLRGDTIHD